jgi:16S rRNA (guanine527-N7)-methyltransferase
LNRTEERQRIDAGARALGVALDELQLDRLQQYLDLLERWNRSHNLSAVRDRGAMVVQHLLDCLGIVAPLRRERPAGGRLLDVGSGGGLPGLVVAIAAPEWRVCSIDAVAKKAAFVRQVAGALRLDNVEVRHGRVEEVADPHDVIVSRAFGSLADFVRLSARARAPQGVWLAMKGREPQAEITALPADVEVFHVEPLRVPELDGSRCAVWMRPRG